MNQLSDGACDLLLTIRRRGVKTQAGQLTSNDRMCMWYELEEDDFESELKPLINELLSGKYIKRFNDEDDQYKLLPKGENYNKHSLGMTVNTFSNISNSQIANMSNEVRQKLNIESLDDATRQQLDELIAALEKKDDSRAGEIIDGLLVSAPSLVLQILQIGLGIGSK